MIVSLVVVIAFLVPLAVSSSTDKKERKQGGDHREVAASCASKCHDMCVVLTKSEDPLCGWRCDSMSIFNTSILDPAALDPETASVAVQEIQMCSRECYMRCTAPEAGSSCNDKCTETFRPFGPAFAALDKTMAASGLAGPAKPPPHDPAGGKPFETCSKACIRDCASQGTTTKGCGGSCAEACGLYAAATRVLQDAMPPEAVPSPDAMGYDSVAKIFKACSQHCAANDNKCTTKCAFACYVVNKARASMNLATGGYGLPA